VDALRHVHLVIPGRRDSVEPGIYRATEHMVEWIPGPRLERDEFRMNRYRALAYCLSMIFSENRFPLFRIML